MTPVKILTCLDELQATITSEKFSGKTVGSVHTLGSLHKGHETCIKMAADENDLVVVSIYPNKAQLRPGTVYKYNLTDDIDLATSAGATHIVTPKDDQMYPIDYTTFLDQGDCYGRMDGTVVPFLFRGMITMSFRWVNMVRPTRTYFGMKDIGQTLLLERSLKDFNVPTIVRRVPCVRYNNGVPFSSRLASLDDRSMDDVAIFHNALQAGLDSIRMGLIQRSQVVDVMLEYIASNPMSSFRSYYIDCFDTRDFSYKDTLTPPFILHGVITNGEIDHFDGLLIETIEDLAKGPDIILLEAK